MNVNWKKVGKWAFGLVLAILFGLPGIFAFLTYSTHRLKKITKFFLIRWVLGFARVVFLVGTVVSTVVTLGIITSGF